MREPDHTSSWLVCGAAALSAGLAFTLPTDVHAQEAPAASPAPRRELQIGRAHV